MPLARTGYGGPVNVHTGRGAGMPRGGRPAAPSGPGGFPPVRSNPRSDPFAGLPVVTPPPRGGRTAGPPIKGGRGKAAAPAGPAPAAAPPAPGIPPSKFINAAKTALGDPYTWGGATPKAGFDCSGLVQYALTQAGLKNVPRTSEAQYAWSQRISQAQLQPGDLIFEQWPGDQTAPGHVAIYLGGGRIEEAATAGTPVHVVPWSPGQVAAQGGTIVGYGRPPGLQNSHAANLAAGQAGAAAATGGGGGGGTLPIGGILPKVPPAGGGGGGTTGGGGGGGGGRPRGGGGGIQTTAATGSGPDAAAGAAILGPLGVLLGGAGAVGTAGRALADTTTALEWFFVPSHWVRIFAGVGGVLALSTGVFMMSHTGGSVEVGPLGSVSTPRGATLPMGILLTGAGGVLLFIAFHNLPAQVDSLGGMLGWLAARSSGAVTGAAAPAGGRGTGSSGQAGAGQAPLPIGNLKPAAAA